MPQFLFGSGACWGTPTTDANGAALSNQVPLQLGVLQEASVDVSADIKMLYGQNQYPVAQGRGKGKISGKAKFAQVNGLIFNSLFFGQTVTSSLLAVFSDITGVAIPATPFTITPTVPSSGTWLTDLGVRNAAGNPMTKVASAPATGQYSVTAGAYLFAAADTGQTVFISFQYTATSAAAKTSTVSNLPMGAAPSFRFDFFDQLGGNGLDLILFNCVASKINFASKQDDFWVLELDFEAFADSANRVMQWGTAQ